jgi:uncharacterized protein YbjT (DUF2867 family)
VLPVLAGTLSYENILVTGATGKVGSRFVPRLLAKGYDVRILVSNAAKAVNLVALGAEVVTGICLMPVV